MSSKRNSAARPFSDAICIHTIIERQAGRTPGRTAVVFGNKALTYRELNTQANQLAHFLKKKGVGPDGVVGLYMGRSIELMVALLGVLKAGAAYVPLDPQYPKDRLEYMAADSRAEVILMPTETEDHLNSAQGKELPFASPPSRRLWKDESQKNPKVSGLSSRNLAHLLYTSGSTGRPKGVEIEHRSVVNFLESLAEILEFSEREIVMSVTGLTFDIAGLDLYLTWMKGAKLVMVPRSVVLDGALLRTALKKSKATLLQTTPVTWRGLMDADWVAPPGFKALCGGEMLPRQLLDDFSKQPLRLWNLYGPTETTIWSTVCAITPEEFHARGRISVGRPIANTYVYVLNDHLKPALAGCVGEVHIGGDGLARGYRNQPELTIEKFVPDPFRHGKNMRMYRTGDLGCFRPTGEIELLGRKDHQIKLHGYRIEPGEIESAIRRVTGIKDSLVMLKDVRGVPALIAYLVAPKVPSHLAKKLSQLLPAYMLPAHYVCLSNFPQTQNGKVDRSALPPPERGRQ